MDAETGNNESWSEMLENTRLGTVSLTHSNFACWNVVNIMDEWRIEWYSIGGSTRVEVKNDVIAGGSCGYHRGNTSNMSNLCW